jgi:glycine cleavage system H protein
MADYTIPDDLRYSEDDEWVRTDTDIVEIGITDYAQDQLGDIVFVELPEMGNRVEQGAAFGVIESVKAVSDLYAPVSGTVIEINDTLVDNPEQVNEDCYESGWIVKIQCSNGSEIDQLLDAPTYRASVTDRTS